MSNYVTRSTTDSGVVRDPGSRPGASFGTGASQPVSLERAPAGDWPALALGFEPTVEVVAGEPTRLPLAVRNDSPAWVRAKVDLAGLAPGWVSLPLIVGPLAPGETRNANLTLLLPAGYPPCLIPLALRATALGPRSGEPVASPASAHVYLRISATATVVLSAPDQVLGTRRARFDVSVQNRTREAQIIELSASSRAGVHASFATGELSLPPGATATVRARVGHARPVAGIPRRYPFILQARASGAPAVTQATFVQRPWLPEWSMRALALVLTVLVFAALALFLIARLSSAYGPKVLPAPLLTPATSVRPKAPSAPRTERALSRPPALQRART
ncbi:MAG: COG1470 family protein [Acidimicrobiales bacterium]|jgi:hypothetical protein